MTEEVAVGVQEEEVKTVAKKAPRKKKEVVVTVSVPTEEVMIVQEEVKSAKKAPRKKKEVVVVVPEITAPAAAIITETDDYYMIPDSVIPEGKYWTQDENYRNGPVYGNGKDEDGDSAPTGVVGRLENGNVIFD